ncbi:cupin domain-containing protein [Actinomadura decatromicini]|uniref:Cupin domain-containing protein n=1 Tax=Actinomadura decatromicini TaxID=2604572 RepID=A0A5D3FZK9_9ACTN|nr:cupin domain-containing protein [Actinomadura decatromicini]TYK53160.1 cupin domain-containing protein [Actinomadura decatromicini]
MTDGLVIPPGAGRKFVTRAQEVTFKVTGDHSRTGSLFEVVVPPGFDVGAHVHTRTEEIFYVLDGELELLAFEPEQRTPDDWRSWRGADGRRPVRAGAGSCMFVPAGCPHAFTNPHDTPARMLFLSAPPPDHEAYFEELLEMFDSGTANVDAVINLREKYDIQQITPLRFDAAES